MIWLLNHRITNDWLCIIIIKITRHFLDFVHVNIMKKEQICFTRHCFPSFDVTPNIHTVKFYTKSVKILSTSKLVSTLATWLLYCINTMGLFHCTTYLAWSHTMPNSRCILSDNTQTIYAQNACHPLPMLKQWRKKTQFFANTILKPWFKVTMVWSWTETILVCFGIVDKKSHLRFTEFNHSTTK